MRVFVTGATGFVGTAVVQELLSAGHTVLGLSRGEAGVKKLQDQGAEALHGTIEDLELLRKAATESDAVIHLAFIHNFAEFANSCAIDQAAVRAMGEALVAAGGDRALVVTTGTLLVAPKPGGEPVTEYDPTNMSHPMGALRGPVEPLCLGFAKRGVRASVVRLSPITHGKGSSGFAAVFVLAALEKGVSAYVGDGTSRLPAGHVADAARAYRLVVEKAKPGSIFHTVAEEGVLTKDIAAAVGKELGVPVVSITPTDAQEHFGVMAFVGTISGVASSPHTREQLGWAPTNLTLVEDMPNIVAYFKSQEK